MHVNCKRDQVVEKDYLYPVINRLKLNLNTIFIANTFTDDNS